MSKKDLIIYELKLKSEMFLQKHLEAEKQIKEIKKEIKALNKT